jgi:ribose transport system permease protein
MRNLNKLSRFFIVGPLIALVLAVILITFTTDRFMTAQNLMNVSLQVSAVAIAAIGGTMVILTGGIDLSPGSSVALTTCVLAVLVKLMGLPLPLGILVVLVMGAAMGAVNGVLTAYGRIPTFIVTLATLSVYRGLAFLITEGTPIFNISPGLDRVFYDRLFGIPLPFYYVMVLYVLTYVFLRHTSLGRAIYAVGGNESAARLSGIQVKRVRLAAFILAGFTASISGVLLAARLNSGSPNYGVGLELQAIAAAVIGGASLSGGIGNIVYTLFGALTVAVVQNGLNLNAVPAAWQNITLGLIIVLAVSLDMWRADLGRGLSRIFSFERSEEKQDRTASD